MSHTNLTKTFSVCDSKQKSLGNIEPLNYFLGGARWCVNNKELNRRIEKSEFNFSDITIARNNGIMVMCRCKPGAIDPVQLYSNCIVVAYEISSQLHLQSGDFTLPRQVTGYPSKAYDLLSVIR